MVSIESSAEERMRRCVTETDVDTWQRDCIHTTRSQLDRHKYLEEYMVNLDTFRWCSASLCLGLFVFFLYIFLVAYAKHGSCVNFYR